MPTSDFISVTDIAYLIRSIKPKSILDIGIGFGKWGFLSREILDIDQFEPNMKEKVFTTIDGIEIDEKYISDIQRLVYDKIYIGNALDVLQEKEIKYDLILICDVIEHFKKKEGIELIRKCKEVSNNIILTTPYIYSKQGEAFGNIYESHLSGWEYDDFKSMGAKYIWNKGSILIAVFTEKSLETPCYNETELNFNNYTDINDLINIYCDTKQVKEAYGIYIKYVSMILKDLKSLSLSSYFKINQLVDDNVQFKDFRNLFQYIYDEYIYQYRKYILVDKFKFDKKNYNIAIYGVGNHTKNMIEWYIQNEDDIKCNLFFIDSDINKHGKEFLKYKIYNPIDLKELNLDLIIIASQMYANEMYETCKKYADNSVEIEKMYSLYDRLLF